jgi:hypothetical protein
MRWVWWLKFERQHGTAAQREDVIVRYHAAEPRHGEMWQPIAMDDKNGGKSAKEILDLQLRSYQTRTSSKSIGLYPTQRYRTNKPDHGDIKKNTVTDVSGPKRWTLMTIASGK